MVETCAGKGIRIVTNGTVLSGWRMGRRHACCRLPIVTRSAIVRDARMIKDRGGKTAGYVTETAIVGRREMIDILSCCRNAVMAGCAVTDDVGMIENRAGKAGCIVANTAIFGGGDMRRRLRKGADSIVGTIVARDAIIGDAGMIEYRRIERRLGVASVAVLVCGHMY